MKIVADECVDQGIVTRLRRDGHDVSYMAEMSPGIMDEEVLVLAGEDNTLFVTADKDFGELVFRQGHVKKAYFCIALQDFLQVIKRKLFHKQSLSMATNCFKHSALLLKERFGFVKFSEYD